MLFHISLLSYNSFELNSPECYSGYSHTLIAQFILLELVIFKDLLFLNNSFKAPQTITTIQQDIFGCFRRRNLQQENLLK